MTEKQERITKKSLETKPNHNSSKNINKNIYVHKWIFQKEK